jgi:hypothetical protein
MSVFQFGLRSLNFGPGGVINPDTVLFAICAGFAFWFAC